MDIRELQIEGFRSFVHPQSLSLSKVPAGLYLVKGNNLVEPNLEGNGVGKSSIFEAIYWCMFGSTSRKLKAGAVRSWDSDKTCSVTADLDCGLVARTWGPNSLTLNGEVVDQETLEKRIGLTPELALSTLYFAQFTPFFLDLLPTARMEIYSSVMGFDFWDNKSDRAKQLSKEAEGGVQHLQVELARLQGKLSTLQSVNLQEQIKRWDETHADKIKVAEEDLRVVNMEAQEVGAKLSHMVEEEKEAKRIHASSQKRITSGAQALEKAQTALAEALSEQKSIGNRMTRLSDQITGFKKQGTGKCNACGQVITKEHSAKHVKALQNEQGLLQVQLDMITLQVDVTRQDLKEANVNLEEAKAALPELPILRQRREALEQDVARANRRKYSAAQTLTAMKAEENPFRKQQSDTRKEIAAVKIQLTSKEKEIKELEVLQARFEFWIKGFKDVRLQIMQESLVQLNAEANECLHELGLVDWELEFAVEKETKSGTIKRGFTCSVLSPYTKAAVPWEAWSGGESQRLKLGAQLGVSNLLCSRLGTEFGFEMWDEPSSWLSGGGIKDFLAVLQERAHRYGRRIFLADHRVFDFDFDGVLHVEKTEEGSAFDTVEML